MDGLDPEAVGGAPWKDLPVRYPPYQTCHRRFQRWSREDVLPGMLEQLASDLHSQGEVDLSKCFGDETSAQKGDARSAYPEGTMKPSGERIPKLWPSQMLLVFRSPLVYDLLSVARPNLLEALVHKGFSPIYSDDV